MTSLLPPRPFRRASLATWLAQRIEPGHYVRLDYPPSPPPPGRYGHGRPSHPQLAALLGRHHPAIAEELRRLVAWRDDLAAIPEAVARPPEPLRPPAPGRPRRPDASGSTEPHWRNGFLFGIDGATIYSFIRQRRPRRYLEIGSGNSTLFAARAVRDGHLDTHLTSIDPAPRRQIDSLCHTVIRSALQDVPPETFTALEPGDVVFFDGTHRVFTNSDATVFFLDILPVLPTGVLVGIHDIHLPDDYRPEHHHRYYSEQYLLAAYLLAGCPWLRIVLPCWYVATTPALAEIIRPLTDLPALATLADPGLVFWLALTR